jgi:hypothetical protein
VLGVVIEEPVIRESFWVVVKLEMRVEAFSYAVCQASRATIGVSMVLRGYVVAVGVRTAIGFEDAQG